MGITSSLQIGRSALTASELAIQVTGNNLANAATPGYSRQIAYLQPARGDGSFPGNSIGSGVNVRDIRRQVDQALQARLWSSTSSQAGADQTLSILSGLESSLNELSGNDLSSALTHFFGAWSDRANLTQSSGVVVQQGDTLAGFVRRLRTDLTGQRSQIDTQLGASVDQADGVLSQIASLNTAISTSEVGGTTANSLRDQRDTLVGRLSELMDVSAVEQPGGSVNILAGSTPIVLGGVSRGLTLKRETVNGKIVASVRVKEDGDKLSVSAGSIGSLLAGRESAINDTISTLDSIASQLIFQVNRLHSTGTNADGLRTTTGTLSVPTADRTRALNDPANDTFGNLPFKAVSGGFLVNVKQAATGATQTVRINVDLDGVTAAGAPGTADDTSLENIRAGLDAIDGITATITPDGKLKVDADQGFQFSFQDDTSGVLAVTGVNAYFTGKDASDIGVRDDLKTDPSLLTVGRIQNGQFVANGTALQLAQVQDQSLAALGNQSLRAKWSATAQSVGSQTDAAKTNSDAAGLVRGSLDAQRSAVSGVSVDEEAINLMNYQRQYQGAAHFISVVDQLSQALLAIV
jgi:flagellar hook-associated protein 1 FlgK